MKEVKIFISYSHDDAEQFNTFKKEIENHSKNSKQIKWDLWSDIEIPVGSMWHETIQEAVQQSKAAILLVSASFFASDYIKNEEFLKFVEKNKQEGFTFFPVLLSDCDFSQWEELVKIQFFNPKGHEYGVESFKNKIVPYDYVEKQHLKNTYHRKCVEAFEKAILSKQNTQQQNLISKNNNSSLMSVLSNKDILNALNLFQKRTIERKLDEKELAEAVDFKDKLYGEIFGNFDDQLENIHKDKLASVVFDRIVFASEQIQNPDIDRIQKFRNNKKYEDKDRSLIVSGLTISLLNHFDSKKIHLLIDFLTDFEEEVWQKALVGLLFALTRYNNRLSSLPEIEKRLNELKEIADIQKSIFLIDRILRYSTFSGKEQYKKNPKRIFNKLKMVFGDSIDFSQEDLIELQNDLNKLSDTTAEGRMLNTLFKKEVIDKFVCALDKAESVTLTIEDFFNLVDFETYIELNELNPLHLNLTDDFFKSSYKWFMPFKYNENIHEKLMVNFPADDIEILDFISMIQQSTISDIDKHYILTHIKQFSDDFIHMLYTMLFVETSLSADIPTLESTLTKIIRDLYRFDKLSVISLNNNIFDKKLSIYGQSLLEKIANSITEIKVNSQYLYDNDEYEESLKNLQNIPNNKYDLEILRLFMDNYIALDKDEEAIPYLNEAIKLNSNDENFWNNKGNCLYNLQQYENAIVCYDEAIKINPNNESYWNKKGNCLYNLQQDENAIICYDEAIKINPNNESYWNNKGNCLCNLQQYENAIVCYGEAVKLNPNDDVLWNNKSNCLYYKLRQRYEDTIDSDVVIIDMIHDTSENIVKSAKKSDDYELLKKELLKVFALAVPISEDDFHSLKDSVISKKIAESAIENFKQKMDRLAEIANPVVKQVYENQGAMYENILIPISDGKLVYNIPTNLKEAYETDSKSLVKSFEKVILLHTIDEDWKEHFLREMNELRQSVQNVSYQQKDPLLIYKLEAFNIFKTMINSINSKSVSILMRGHIPMQDSAATR